MGEHRINLLILAAVVLGVVCFLWGVDDALDAKYTPPVQVTAPKPHAQYYERLGDRELAEVYNLTPDDVNKPITIFRKDTK